MFVFRVEDLCLAFGVEDFVFRVEDCCLVSSLQG